ncbi:MAG: hypothetical protein MI755_06840 [Sphingomonadales bacterium]|nr:hypothetical protein [Sphingomonadales bacterium]
MTDKPTTLTDPVLRLTQYWLSARIMHAHLHEMVDAYPDLDDLRKDGQQFHFLTYFSFWLSALYVVAEGYIELGLRDSELDKLIRRHIGSLRRYRNATFHFQRQPNKHTQFFDAGYKKLNWAEDLHAAIDGFLCQYVLELERAERQTVSD